MSIEMSIKGIDEHSTVGALSTHDPFCLLVLVQAVDHNSYEGSHTDCISLDDSWYYSFNVSFSICPAVQANVGNE